VDVSQRRELNDGLFHRSSGSFELVLAPLLLALLGLWIDHKIGTTPIFTIVFAVAGLAGVVLKTYYVYRASIDAMRRDRASAGLP
jgi:F0F1-type ATP synthase assembly protein I